MPERSLEVIYSGVMSTVQDLGRPGFAHLGVPRSGALDEPALRLANRLVGNADGAAGLETTLNGLGIRLSHVTTVAVTGAEAQVFVGERSVAWGEAVSVPAGGLLRVGPARRGLRSYVALAGGVLGPATLGSRSTDLLSGLGPDRLLPHDVLPLGQPTGTPQGLDGHRGFEPTTELRVRSGPRADWCEPMTRSSYAVGSRSNRIGLRLEGAPINRVRDGELASEGVVLGAVQVPPNGQPVIFLADHPTTGGYPVIGVVVAADLPGCAQLRPGETITLRPV